MPVHPHKSDGARRSEVYSVRMYTGCVLALCEVRLPGGSVCRLLSVLGCGVRVEVLMSEDRG